MFDIKFVNGDILSAKVDVLVMKFADAFHGADRLVPRIAESRHRAGRRSRWNAEHTDGTGRDSRFTDVGY